MTSDVPSSFLRILQSISGSVAKAPLNVRQAANLVVKHMPWSVPLLKCLQESKGGSSAMPSYLSQTERQIAQAMWLLRPYLSHCQWTYLVEGKICGESFLLKRKTCINLVSPNKPTCDGSRCLPATISMPSRSSSAA